MSVMPTCKVCLVLIAIGSIPSFFDFSPALASPQQVPKNGLLLSKQKNLPAQAAGQPLRDPLTDYDYAHSKQYLDLRVKNCTSRLEKNPNDPTQLIIRGVAYWKLEDFPKALADLKKGVSLSPPAGSASVYRILGECYAEIDQPENAILAFSKAIKLSQFPESIKILYLRRAQAYTMAKNYSEALKDADKVVLLNNSKLWALEVRARISMNAGRYVNAVKDYSECIRQEPDNPNYYAERAKAYQSLGKYKLAEADRKKRDSMDSDFR